MTDAPVADLAPVAPATIAGARILLVDDDPFTRRLTQRMLANLGADVRVAADGMQAVDMVRDQSFDCVLMDVQMPGMDGLQATRIIRAGNASPGLPVLALAGNDSIDDRARCFQAGMNDFIAKPAARDVVRAMVEAWLNPGPVAARALVVVTEPEAPVAAAAPVDDDARVVDLRVLMEAVSGDEPKFRRYAELFVETASETLDEMGAARARGDTDALSKLGHRLKSSARMVGAMTLAAHCELLEAMGSANAEQAGRLVNDMEVIAACVFSDIADALSGMRIRAVEA